MTDNEYDQQVTATMRADMNLEWNDIQGNLPALGFAKQSASRQSKRAMLFGWLVAQDVDCVEALTICNQTPRNGWDV